MAEAFRRAGLREFLPSRMTRHTLADAAEALLLYAWLRNSITLEESVLAMEKNPGAVKGLRQLLAAVKERLTFP